MKNKNRRKKGASTKTNHQDPRNLAPARWWKQALDTNLLIAFGTIAAAVIAAIAIFIHSCESQEALHRTHRPQIVFSGPVEIDEMDCSTENKQNSVWVGKPRVFLKNIGNADAVKVFPAIISPGLKLIPSHKTGVKSIDDWPDINDATCRQGMSQNPRFTAFPIYSRGAWTFDSMRQEGAGSQPAFGKGALVELVWPWCFGYSDEYGLEHATCATFLFRHSGSDSDFFTCSKPVTGAFEVALQGHCEN